MRRAALLFILSTPSMTIASGSYLFGLTQADVDDVWDHYNGGTTEFTKADLENSITAPFDCAKFGDLCEVFGAPAAEAWIGSIWTRALAHEDLHAESGAIWDDLMVAWEDWLDAEFPSGIPAQHAYWASDGLPPDLTPMMPCGCQGSFTNSPRRDVSSVTVGSVTTRVRYRTFMVQTVLYNALGATVERHRDEGTGFDKDRSQFLSVNNLYSGMGTQCHCTWCEGASAQNWRASHRMWAIMTGPGFENVRAGLNGGLGHTPRTLNRQTSFRSACL